MSWPATAARAAAALPAASVTRPMAVRALRPWLANYRRTWRGSVTSSLLFPFLYLGAMGLGLGSLVDARGTAGLGGVSYLVFLAPGLLAASAMQTAIGNATYPVLGSVKWEKTYLAAVATPLRPRDIFHGHLLFIALRLTLNSMIFVAVMALFGAARSAWVLAAIPVAVLTGLAFAAPVEAFAVLQDRDQPFSLLQRFGMVPLFLFSGTFFPVTQLPGWARPVAYATPLWHGVALCRSLSLGQATAAGTLEHAGYLAALAVAGIAAGNRAYRRRLHA